MPSDSVWDSNSINDAATRVGDRLAEATSAAKNTVSDHGRSAVVTANENREAAARGLQSAAATLREKADSLPGGQKVTSFAHSTADTLSSTADYVRQNDVKSMMGDLETMVKNNPGPSLLAAAAVGFLIGRAVSRD